MDSQSWNILMVDDDEDDYILTRQMLTGSKYGKYILDWAKTYEEGWKKIQVGGYDAVLMDYDLGSGNGLELIRKAEANGYPFPIILFTGRGSYEVDIQAMQAGAALYLTKNEVNPLLLERGIRYAIERKRDQMLLLQHDEALLRINVDLKDELNKRQQVEEELKEKSQKLQETLDRQKLLSEAGAELLAGADPIERLDDFFKRISQSLGLEIYVQYNVSADGTHLELGKLGGLPPRYYKVLAQLEFGQAVCGTVAQTRHPMYVNDVQKSEDRKTRLIRSLGIDTYACHPLIVNGQLLGTLSFGSRKLSRFDAETIDLLKTFCNMVANALARKQTEEALRREQELLQKLFERIPVMITMYRPDLHMTQFNPKFEELIGWKTEDAQQADFDLMEKFYPDPEYRRMVANYMQSLREGWRDFEVTAKDGTIVESSWTNLRLSDDTQIGIGIDVRERKRAEEALRAEQATIKSILDATKESIWLFDPDGTIRLANETATSRFKKPPEEIIGKHYSAFIPADVAHTRQLRLREVVEKKQPLEFEDQRAGISFHHTFYPVIDTVGQVTGVVAFSRDITEQRQAEAEREHLLKALADERARLLAVFNSAPAGFVVADDQARILTTNKLANQLYNRPIPIGRDFASHAELQICYSDGSPCEPRNLPLTRSALDGEKISNLEMLINWPDGQRRPLLVNTAPVLDAEGRISGAVGVFQDISRLKQVEADLERYARRLEQSNRDLEDFAFIASHDMQEPLRKILSFACQLQSTASSKLDEDENDYLERMCRAAERMLTMLNGLLEYSRVNTTTRPNGRVDLAQIAKDVLLDLELQINRSGGKVEVGKMPVIQAEPTQMHQLLLNLITNALKFSRPGIPPEVKVSSCLIERGSPPQSQMAEIRVEDNGIGFDPEYASTLFLPFHRLVGRSDYEGSGMGLAICRKIAERYGGTIEANSRPGEGATFIVRLPVVLEE